MRLKGDKCVNQALDSRIERETEWTRKSSTIVEANKIFQDNLEKNKYKILYINAERTDKEVNLRKAKKATKESLKEETLKKWKDKN